ncbi:MAG TPA: antitoxin VapB family protein [Candidatus Bathyarchaeia archaeon]
MAHKTLTISEEAYNALARVKSKDESFTKVILRLTGKKAKGNLLEYIKSIGPNNELADRLEIVLAERSRIRLGARGR